ncbi:hypothetical protein [Streptomyces purpurogeneiscleroticus]|uniref:hypothetical protein n=1 Tax=Streptomyces purpurogeneiscleroticus TaxID=68259 RepID=UPI001CBF89C1|nr:hypothetical protein [Streptomyces purpurogeneiscleroticus]MBZ4014787.1 hypothetical protein [Streptomyces purpurogeneiscleroticus]
MTYVIAMWAVGALFLVLACVPQRSVYWSLQAWKYRNPKAAEPSDAAYAMQRFGAVVAALFLFGLGAFLWYEEQASTTDSDEVRTAVMKAVHILETEPTTATGGELMEPDHHMDVDAALDEATEAQAPAFGPSSWGLQAEPAGRSDADDGELFTVTNEDDQYPYCLKVVENPVADDDSEGLVLHETTLDVTVRKGSCEG